MEENKEKKQKDGLFLSSLNKLGEQKKSSGARRSSVASVSEDQSVSNFLQLRLNELEEKMNKIAGKESVEKKGENGYRDAEKKSMESQSTEILSYLKRKIDELEGKLSQSQEKALSFAYELKGRQEAQKESREEMEKFLAMVKQQQFMSKAEQMREIELEKARGRADALEQKIMELSENLSSRKEIVKMEIPQEEIEKLRAMIREDMENSIVSLAKNLSKTVAKETEKTVESLLEKESSAREKDKNDFHQLVSSMAKRAEEIEKEVSGRLSGLNENILEIREQRLESKEENDRLISELKSGIKRSIEDLEKEKDARQKDKKDFYQLASSLEKRAEEVDDLRSEFKSLCERLDVPRMDNYLAGCVAADETAQKLGIVRDAYAFGFIMTSLNNLEKSFSEALETVGRARVGFEDADNSNGHNFSLARGHMSILDTTIKDMADTLSVFKNTKDEIVNVLRKEIRESEEK